MLPIKVENVECNPLMYSEIRKVRAAKGEHALCVSYCVLGSCVLGSNELHSRNRMKCHRPAGGQPVRDVAARTAGAEHPTTVYVGCGDCRIVCVKHKIDEHRIRYYMH